MDIRHLEYLVAVAEQGSFSSAARHLHISQPSLSSLVKRVENELRVQVFDRSTTPVSTTAAGQLFVDRARELVAGYRTARADAQALASARPGRVRIGATFLVAARLFPPLLARAGRAGRGSWLELVEGSGRELAELVAGGLMDCAVMSTPAHRENLDVPPVLATDLVVAFPAGSAWAEGLSAGAPVTAEQLGGLPLLLQKEGGIRSVVEAWFRTHAGTPHVVFESRGTDTLLALVRLGTGVAVVPRVFVPAEDVAGPEHPDGAFSLLELADPVPRSAICLVRRRAAPQHPDLEAAAALVRAEVGSWRAAGAPS